MKIKAFWPNRCCNSTVKITACTWTHTCSCRCTVGWLLVTQAYQRWCHPNNFGHQRCHRQKATQSVSVLDAERVHHGHVLLVSHRLSEEKTTFKRDAGELQWGLLLRPQTNSGRTTKCRCICHRYTAVLVTCYTVHSFHSHKQATCSVFSVWQCVVWVMTTKSFLPGNVCLFDWGRSWATHVYLLA